MILRRAFAPTVASLVGLSLALPASAWPLRHGAYRHVDAPPVVAVDCDVSLRNACFLQMNSCLSRNAHSLYVSRPPNFYNAIRACEAAYFTCIFRYKCERGPVW
jgi:hypothetical protein